MQGENGGVPRPQAAAQEGPKMVSSKCMASVNCIFVGCGLGERCPSLARVNCTTCSCASSQSPEIRKYKRKFNGEILCGALWGVNLLVGTDNGLLLLDRSGHGKG